MRGEQCWLMPVLRYRNEGMTAGVSFAVCAKPGNKCLKIDRNT